MCSGIFYQLGFLLLKVLRTEGSRFCSAHFLLKFEIQGWKSEQQSLLPSIPWPALPVFQKQNAVFSLKMGYPAGRL